METNKVNLKSKLKAQNFIFWYEPQDKFHQKSSTNTIHSLHHFDFTKKKERKNNLGDGTVGDKGMHVKQILELSP